MKQRRDFGNRPSYMVSEVLGRGGQICKGNLMGKAVHSANGDGKTRYQYNK